MTPTERYLRHNELYRSNKGRGALPRSPSSHVVIVTCMDARLDVYHILGIEEGEANILRNAGGIVTEDVMRSLIISQRLLGTNEIILIHHTDCGMMSITDDTFADAIAEDTGVRPEIAFHAFEDLADDVREGMRRIRTSPFLPHRNVRGFICEVETGRLHEVKEEAAS